jgi:hypothetical protein
VSPPARRLLESRVRLMYTDGAVSYLDVLLSSTSFTDFLDRADSLKLIVDQDQDLLLQHKMDKQTRRRRRSRSWRANTPRLSSCIPIWNPSAVC